MQHHAGSKTEFNLEKATAHSCVALLGFLVKVGNRSPERSN